MVSKLAAKILQKCFIFILSLTSLLPGTESVWYDSLFVQPRETALYPAFLGERQNGPGTQLGPHLTCPTSVTRF